MAAELEAPLPSPKPTRRKRHIEPRSENVYDGRTYLGTVIHNDRGFEAYTVDDTYIDVFDTHRGATGALLGVHLSAKVVTGAVR